MRRIGTDRPYHHADTIDLELGHNQPPHHFLVRRLFLYTDTHMALTWADKRRLYVIGGAVVIGIMLLAALGISALYEAPSCMDRKQNQDESGIDCGGSCAYLCKNEVQEPRVSFARAIANGNGRTDVIAYIENRNQSAEAKGARYEVEVFDEAGELLGKREGTIDLPPRSTVTLFVPGIYLGIGASPRAFVSFEEDLKWRNARGASEAITVTNADLILGEKPRVNAALTNISPTAVYNRTLIATVFDAGGVAIAASQTVVREIEGRGTEDAVFTWNEPFQGTAVRVEVMSVPLLP